METKKSFVLYCDLIHTIKHLSDEKAGELFKHILHYVNDLDPELKDPMLLIAFEPIKQSLKRDLEKWKGIKEKRVEAGRKGGQQKVANSSKVNQTKSNVAVNGNVSATANVNVIDNDIVKVILKNFNFLFNKKARIIPQAARMLYFDLFKEGYTIDDVISAMVAASRDKWHKEQNYEVTTLFYFAKVEVVDRYSSQNNKQKYIPTK